MDLDTRGPLDFLNQECLHRERKRSVLQELSGAQSSTTHDDWHSLHEFTKCLASATEGRSVSLVHNKG